MDFIQKAKKIPRWQKARYLIIIGSCGLFFAPFLIIPRLFHSSDFCGTLCIRRFYLYYPGMALEDISTQFAVSAAGVILLSLILLTTFLFGRLWCGYLCPVGGFPELISRMLNDRIKIEYRALPQITIRYGYFGFYILAMPMLGISACTICNFLTIPRLFEALGGGERGIGFLCSSIGLANLALVALLGFFASKGRAYCAFLCPIGAIDGIVNRLGAGFNFTRRIRVRRETCTGCAQCAVACMCGAIQMKDDIAVVDQLACMSCHECADVCRFNSVEYMVVPPARKQFGRKKAAMDMPAEPVWAAVYKENRTEVPAKSVNWRRVSFIAVSIIITLFILITESSAASRKVDPDGCFSCHAFKGLSYIDKQGLIRDASIDKSHYYSSLHGSVPCKDCHRKIKEYPHNPKNGEVDCAESCHIKEPSKDEKYSHKAIVEEQKKSVHKSGWTKGLSGGNRLKEVKEEQNPSCRKCHSNTLYMEMDRLSAFKKVFTKCDKECGTCHQGEVWKNQYIGHILRRFLGRWGKSDGNRLCNDCHRDQEKMVKVEIKDEKTGKKKKADPKFVLASETYNMTLHKKLLEQGNDKGVSCIGCHSPSGYRHEVRRADDQLSSTNEKNLAKTCGNSGNEGCHSYSGSPFNDGFLRTDMHSLDFAPLNSLHAQMDIRHFSSNWFYGAVSIVPMAIVLLALSLLWTLFRLKKKKKVHPFVGGNFFKRKMLKKSGKKTMLWFLFFALSATGIPTTVFATQGSLYLEKVNKAEVEAKELAEAKKQIEELKKVEIIDDLSLPAYHKRVPKGKRGKEPICFQCHIATPHRDNEITRSFLNMHSEFISCQVCHFDEKETVFENRWLSYGGKTALDKGDKELVADGVSKRHSDKKIALYHDGRPLPVLRDHPFSIEVAKKWESSGIDEKALLKAKLHKPLKKKGYECGECHNRKQNVLNFKALGFSPERIKEIEQNRISRFIDRYLKEKKKIRLTNLID